jgi:hypothetical protein
MRVRPRTVRIREAKPSTATIVEDGDEEGDRTVEVGMEVKARAGAACYARLDIVCAARSREAQPKSYSGRRQGRRWRRRSIDTRVQIVARRRRRGEKERALRRHCGSA